MGIFNLFKYLPFSKIIIKRTAICSGATSLIAYNIWQTCQAIRNIVNPNVINRDTRQPEYIYVDNPTHNNAMKEEEDDELQQLLSISRFWKKSFSFIRHSLAWRLLRLARYGSEEQRNIAIERLAAFKNVKVWDCCKIAQALDINTAVLLARTRGVDLRYFLPPPLHIRRQALSSNLLSYKFRDLLIAVQEGNPHYCIQHLIHKYFMDVQEPAIENVEVDFVPSKPDSFNERELCILCLEALYHHLSLFVVPNYEEDKSVKTLVNMGLLSVLAETTLRYPNDMEFDSAIVKILTIVSVHTNLLKDFFQLGLIKELSRLLRSDQVNLSTSAAVSLANLSGEYCYRPGLFLLHPIYRTTTPQYCDIVLVHGLRGGVFVTWRQRDKKCAKPKGIIEISTEDNTCMDSECTEKKEAAKKKYLNPDLQKVMDDYLEKDDEATLADIEVILHDVPIGTLREPPKNDIYLAIKKRIAMLEEEEDKCSYTFCWPKDWLPRDCKNLRILGINYWSSVSHWFENCPLQSASIESRASDLLPVLIDAEVGTKNAPVVWLTHSMGGLIVKQALINGAQSDDRRWKSLAENTKAVFFYSTPHRGSSLATMPRAAAAVIWPSHDVKQLQVNSPVLLELQKSFIEFANLYDWETISFGEALPTLVTALKLPVRLVDTVSSDLGRGVFYQLPLDHLAICKPATRQSILYTTVLDVVLRSCPQHNEIQESRIWLFIYDLIRLLKLKLRDIIEV